MITQYILQPSMSASIVVGASKLHLCHHLSIFHVGIFTTWKSMLQIAGVSWEIIIKPLGIQMTTKQTHFWYQQVKSLLILTVWSDCVFRNSNSPTVYHLASLVCFKELQCRLMKYSFTAMKTKAYISTVHFVRKHYISTPAQCSLWLKRSRNAYKVHGTTSSTLPTSSHLLWFV